MSEFLTWLWGVVIAGLSWLVWLLWQGITWAAWLLWQGVTWLAALVVAHWLVALWIVLAVAAVVLFLWARSRISDAEGYMRGALRDRDRALSRGSEAADEARRVKEELALSDNELRRQRDAMGEEQDEALKKLAGARGENRRLRDQINNIRDDNNRLRDDLDRRGR